MAEAKHYRWSDLPREELAPGLGRRFVHGEKAMVAQVYFTKGTPVAKHVHVNEQITFVLEGALRLVLGEHGEQVIDVRAGEVLVIPGGLPHSAEALEDTLDLDVFSPPREDWIRGTDAYLRR